MWSGKFIFTGLNKQGGESADHCKWVRSDQLKPHPSLKKRAAERKGKGEGSTSEVWDEGVFRLIPGPSSLVQSKLMANAPVRPATRSGATTKT